jgi:hypothetical protein
VVDASDDDSYEDDGEAGGCGPCARGGGLLLLVVGLGLGWIGADLLTGGALTRLVTGGGAAVIAASSAAGPLIDEDPGGTDDPDDSGEAGGSGRADGSGPWVVDESEMAGA